MAKMQTRFPTDLIRRFDALTAEHVEMFEEMTQAGAAVVEEHIRQRAPQSVKSSKMMDCLKVTRPYLSQGGEKVNTKVAFYGYFTNLDGKRTPAPLVANVFEYGRGPDKEMKQPFVRKSFTGKDIEEAMLRKQDEIIKANGWEDDR